MDSAPKSEPPVCAVTAASEPFGSDSDEDFLSATIVFDVWTHLQNTKAVTIIQDLVKFLGLRGNLEASAS